MNSLPGEPLRERLCKVSAVKDGEALRVELAGRPPVAVFNVDGQFHVIDDTCTHGDASLSDGYIEGDQVECPWHSGRFCLKTGDALTFPAIQPVNVYRTLIQDAEIIIQLESVNQ